MPYRRDIGASPRGITNLEETVRLNREEKCQLKRDVEAKSLKLRAIKSEVDVKSKALADLEAMPTLSPHDVMKLGRHK